MKVVGIIAEYNPFHSGHAYQLQKARELTEADYVIVAMSGDYVQRGEPAVFSKRLRAEAALRSGADLVLELPVRTSTSSAEGFARGGVELFDSLACVDFLSFGTECTDPELLQSICDVITCESITFSDILMKAMQSGLSYPAAREQAILYSLPETQRSTASTVLRHPNSILALEYMRALRMLNSPISTVPVLREASDYHAEELEYTKPYTSATSLRRSITEHSDGYAAYMPQCMDILEKAHFITNGQPNFLETADLNSLLGFSLMEAIRSKELDQYLDISGDLANRITNLFEKYRTYDSFCSLLKNKSTTYTHVSRALIHILLGLKKQSLRSVSYARVLGFRKTAGPLLKEISSCSRIPLVTSPAKADSVLCAEDLSILQEDIHASDLYQFVYAQKYHTEMRNEYREPVMILE